MACLPVSSSSIVTSGTDCNIVLGVVDKSVLEQDVRLLYCARYGNAILVLKQICILPYHISVFDELFLGYFMSAYCDVHCVCKYECLYLH